MLPEERYSLNIDEECGPAPRALAPCNVGYEKCLPSHFFGPAVRTEWLLSVIFTRCCESSSFSNKPSMS